MKNNLSSPDKPKSKHNAWKIALWVILGIVCLSVILFLAVGVIAATQLTMPKRVFDPDSKSRNVSGWNMRM